MIKRLSLFQNTAQIQLASALIDKSHERVKFSNLKKIYRNITNQKYITNLLAALKKNFKSSSYTLRIKSLIVLHYLIKRTMFQNQRLMFFAETELSQMQEKKNQTASSLKVKKKIQLENQQKQYVQKNIIEFYILYFLKYLAHSEAYCTASKAIQQSKEYFGIIDDLKESQILETTSQTKMEKTSLKFRVDTKTLMFHINNGFKILNLINFIISSQQSFNKMGRYYIQHQQILVLFIMYLDDLTVYSNYTKRLSKILTKTINYIKQEEIKHCFLYLTESQKTSDRLYEFYYNRYYYSKVKKMITMPTFLTIENDDFQRIAKEIKKVDKELFLIVKESKYSQQYKMNKTLGCLTQPDSISNREKQRKINQTMMTETGHRKLDTINKTLQNLKNHQKSKQSAEENIAWYAETFEDIYDDEV